MSASFRPDPTQNPALDPMHMMIPAALPALALEQEQGHALIVLDADARVASWSAGATRIFGYTAHEMLGQTLERLHTREDVERGEPELELRAARAAGRVEHERWQVRKDGGLVWSSGVTTALTDEGGAVVGFVQVSRDRTELHSHLETLERRRDRATEIENDRRVAFGTLAHELRNPLAPLANALQVIRMVASGQPQIGSSVAVIERQVRYIERLVERMLEATWLSSGNATLHYECVELRALVDAALETCSGALAERGQKPDVKLPDALRIEADPLRLQQVLVNLVANASKFSPAGSTIRIYGSVEAGDLVLRVKDDGKGIPPELLPHIFDLFAQARSEDRRAGGGLGLGLAMVKGIVEMHGGAVEAHSEGSGKGTEIVIRLPLVRRLDVEQ